MALSFDSRHSHSRSGMRDFSDAPKDLLSCRRNPIKHVGALNNVQNKDYSQQFDTNNSHHA